MNSHPLGRTCIAHNPVGLQTMAPIKSCIEPRHVASRELLHLVEARTDLWSVLWQTHDLSMVTASYQALCRLIWIIHAEAKREWAILERPDLDLRLNDCRIAERSRQRRGTRERERYARNGKVKWTRGCSASESNLSIPSS
jgi:hypothetical protein